MIIIRDDDVDHHKMMMMIMMIPLVGGEFIAGAQGASYY